MASSSSARNRRPRRAKAEINIVPYVDVMLVLLVIFVITTPLLTQGVKVDLPQASSEPMQSDSQEPVVVTVDANGNYYLNVGEETKKPIDHQVLVNKIAAVIRFNPKTPVLVRGDRNVNYGKVVTAMALIQKAGVPNVGLITEAPEDKRIK
ncbi:MAG: protein TolR [Gammaproteobacteria bacterium]|nr:protein TolR [Gammaproteobacteria bacterium]MDH5692180.1 protein TolR [Gammaproteobacteria bacterium]